MITTGLDILKILKDASDAYYNHTAEDRSARAALSNVTHELTKRFDAGYVGELYRTDYIVEGDDDFPYDMLRYTQSWPTHESEIPHIEQPGIGYPMRRVTLSKYHRDRKPHLAEDRWLSKFSWRVVQIIETVQV